MTLQQFFATVYTQTTLSAIVAIAALIKFKMRSTQVKLIGYSFVLSFACNSAAYVLWHSKYVAFTNVANHIFLLFNYVILAFLYYTVFPRPYRVWLFIATCICVPYLIYEMFIMQKNFLESYSAFTQSFFLLTFTVIYFYRLMVEMPAVHVNRLPMFWFNSALLVFYSGTLFLYAFTSYLIHVLKNDLLAYWSFHNSLGILQQIIILIGLYYDLKNSTTIVSSDGIQIQR